MMKLGNAAFLLAALAMSALPGRILGTRMWQPADAGNSAAGSGLRVARKTSNHHDTGPANASQEMEEVPVVVVEIVDDASAESNGTAPRREEGLSEKCGKEMLELQMNATRFKQAKACEESKNSSYVQQTFDALQRADKAAALAAAATSFHKCAGLSATCAKEVAPQVVLKFRLSGATVSKSCAQAGEKRAAAEAHSVDRKEPCQENTTRAMIQDLGRQDLEAAMDAAQLGLATCAKIEHPCDFQLAPILVMQLMQVVQQQEQEQITEVLFAGMRAAEQASAAESAREGSKPVTKKADESPQALASSSSEKIAAKAAKVMDKVPWRMQRAARNLERRNMPKTGPEHGLLHKARGSKTFKGFSLLDVNERVRIAFRHRAY